MNETITLQCVFEDAGGDRLTKNFPFIKDTEADDTSVKALCDAIITNKALFKVQPAAKVAAYLITTSKEEFDISDD